MVTILLFVILALLAAVVILLLANHNLLGKKVDAAVQKAEANATALNSLFVALGFHPPGVTPVTPISSTRTAPAQLLVADGSIPAAKP